MQYGVSRYDDMQQVDLRWRETIGLATYEIFEPSRCCWWTFQLEYDGRDGSWNDDPRVVSVRPDNEPEQAVQDPRISERLRADLNAYGGAWVLARQLDEDWDYEAKSRIAEWM